MLEMINLEAQYLSFLVRKGLALVHYNPLNRVSSGMKQKWEKFIETQCIIGPVCMCKV